MATNKRQLNGVQTSQEKTEAATLVPRQACGVLYRHTYTCERIEQRAEHTIIARSDGAYKYHTSNAAFGYTITTQTGNRVVEGCGIAPSATTSMHAESVGVLIAVRVAKKFNPEHIIAYTDCEPLIEKIQSAQSTPYQNEVVPAIQNELDGVTDTTVSYPRLGVKQSHNLAQRGIREFTDSGSER